ncbi:MAG: hypothetical protein ACE5SW_01955 [Nitrososphaeraceae archaeon]
MGRLHGNKRPVPKITWAISLELDRRVAKLKGRHDTIDDFVRKVFDQWLEWRDIISFMEEAYEKQSRIIDGYVREIERLKQNQLQLEGIIANN